MTRQIVPLLLVKKHFYWCTQLHDKNVILDHMPKNTKSNFDCFPIILALKNIPEGQILNVLPRCHFSPPFLFTDLLPAKNGEEPTIQFLLEIVDILTNYVKKTFDRSTKVLDFHHPHQLLEGMEGFNLELSDQPESLEQILVDCRDTLKYGVRTGRQRGEAVLTRH